jgi:hypothetical protein
MPGVSKTALVSGTSKRSKNLWTMSKVVPDDHADVDLAAGGRVGVGVRVPAEPVVALHHDHTLAHVA